MEKDRLRGHHPDIIISDYTPTKWQMFIHKINPFASREKENGF